MGSQAARLVNVFCTRNFLYFFENEDRKIYKKSWENIVNMCSRIGQIIFLKKLTENFLIGS